jgi:diguanylate cyclase (GGDEF)-like protein/PAS domain S-box-containing protein
VGSVSKSQPKVQKGWASHLREIGNRAVTHGSPAVPESVIQRFGMLRLLKDGPTVSTYMARGRPGMDPVIVKLADMSRVGTAVSMRLTHEAEVLGQLVGPDGQPFLVDHGVDQGYFWLAHRYQIGQTLAERLERTPLDVDEMLVVARSVLHQLVTAHEHSIIHRDIKPSNVIVSDGPRVENAALIDFGLAESLRLAPSLQDVAVGTARYCSPEQAGLIDLPLDERSDLYSLGLTLFEALAGRPLLDAPLVGEVLHQHLATKPVVSDIVSGVPRAVSELISRLTQTDADRRYQTAEAVLVDVEDIAAARHSGLAEPAVVIGRYDRRRALADPGFVGRHRELAAMETELIEAAGARGGVVFLEGESGSGKSRLLDELARRAAARGFLVLRGYGEDRTASQPFQLFDGVATDLARAAADDAVLARQLRARLSDRADAVATVAPALAHLVGGHRGGNLLPEEHGQNRSIDALSAVLDAAGSGSRPALVILDDCQWSQALSTRVLTAWAARPRHRRILVVAAFRADEVPQSSQLRTVPTHLRLSLAGLASDEVRDLVTSMAGPVPAEAAEAVIRLADGNAFMAQAVLRGMTESRVLVRVDDRWRLDGDSTAEVQTSRQAALFLVKRLDALSPAARTLLSAAAVVGKVSDVDLAIQLSGLSAAEAVPALAELRHRRILWVDEGRSRIRFAHDMLRETALERLTGAERDDLHFRTASHYLHGDEAAPYQVAYHLDMAGLASDAYPHALQAAESARARHALEEAALYYSIARKGATDDAARYRIADGLGEVLSLAGNYGEAERYFKEAAQLAAEPAEEAAELGKLGEVAFRRGDQEEASRLLETAVRTLRGRLPRSQFGLIIALVWELAVQAVHSLSGNRLTRRRRPGATDLLRVRFYSRLAYVYWFRNGRLRCLWVHLREMNLAERFGDRAALAQAYSEHAPVMTMIPWYSRGIDYAGRSLQLRRDLGDVWGQGQSLNFYGVVLYAASRFRESIEAFEESGRILSLTGDRWEMNTGLWNLALAHYRLGEWDRAAAIAGDLVQSAATIGDRASNGIALAIVARATSGRAPNPEAIAEAANRHEEDKHTAAEVQLAMALSLLASGAPEAAAEVLVEAWATVREAGLRQEYVAPLLPWTATMLRAALNAMPPDEPRSRVESQHARTARRSVRLSRSYKNNLPHALRERALARARAGRISAARRDLDRSIAVAVVQDAKWEEAASRLERGRLGSQLGWPGAEADRQTGEAEKFRIESAGRGETAPGTSSTLSLADRFGRLLDTGREIVVSTTAPGVLKGVERAVSSVLRSDHTFAFPVEPDGLPLLDNQAEAAEIVSTSVVNEAVRTHRVVRRDGDGQSGTDDSLAQAGVRSLICVPIESDGRIVACIYATHREVEGLFGDEELQVLQYIATLAGAALEHVAGSEAYFRTLIEHSHDITVVIDAEGGVHYVSPSAERILGRRPEELVGRPQFESMHPDDLEGLVAQWTAVLNDPSRPATAEVRFRHADESWRWMELTLSNRLDDPNVRGLVANLRDATDRRQALTDLARASEQFRLAFDHAPIGMALIDQTPGQPSRILMNNEALDNMIGVTPGRLVGLSLDTLTHPDDQDIGRRARQAFDEGLTDLAGGEIRLRQSSGLYIWVTFHAALIRKESGEPDYFIAQVMDVTEQRQAEETLLHQALHDPLTGLPNRRLIMERLEQALGRAERLGRHLAVLFLDLDRFKVINDTYGHPAGDMVLVEVARRLHALTRTSDTLARLGGDEFVVLVEDLTDVEEPRAIAQRIENSLALPINISDDVVLSVTTSIGIKVARPGDAPSSLLRDADTALYRAKDKGRARYEVYGDHLSIAGGRVIAERDLQSALDGGRLVAMYQPVVDLREGQGVGALAVLHYSDGDHLVGPAEYAPVAEESGLIVPMGNWMLRSSCHDLAEWRSRFQDADLALTLALSPQQLVSAGFADTVRAALYDARIKATSLFLEIDTDHLREALEAGRETLDELHTMGCRIGISGVGGDYDALAYIRRIPVDYLKIDRTIVRGLGGMPGSASPEDETIVAAVIHLAANLDMSCVADGVETADQEVKLRRLGCHLALGPYFGRPRRAEELLLPS